MKPDPSPAPCGLPEIAARAGVSTMTVSLVLRQRPGPSAATRERVLTIAKELGYRPNPLVSAYQAQVRARRRPGFQANLAWINEEAEPDFWRRVGWADGYLKGARARASALGFGLEEFHVPRADKHPRKTERLLRTLRARGIRGVLLPWPADPAQTDKDWSDFAVVTIGAGAHLRDDSPAGGAVFHGARPAMFYNLGLAWRTLRARGYERIGLVIDINNDRLADGSQRARHLLAEADCASPQPPPLVLPAYDESGRAPLARWLREHHPDVVMTYHAAFVLEHAPARGRPDVVQLNLSAGPAGAAGIDSRHAAIAAAAVDLVVGQLYRNEVGPPALPYEIVVKGFWHDGAGLKKKFARAPDAQSCASLPSS